MSAEKPYNSFRAYRPEYLALCGGNACAALLLDLFAYWTQVRASNSEQAQSGGEEGNDLWVYRSLHELEEDLYGGFGRGAIRTGLRLLTERGLIESRRNPNKPWDRTAQYRITHDANLHHVDGADLHHDARARPSHPKDARVSTTARDSKETARDAREAETTQVYDAWLTATDRDPNRTKLSSDRQRCIQRAIDSHSLDDCLTAIQHIGRDRWARGENDRGKRFDDLKHALGSTERIERWRDATEPATNGHKRNVNAGDFSRFADDYVPPEDPFTEEDHKRADAEIQRMLAEMGIGTGRPPEAPSTA